MDMMRNEEMVRAAMARAAQRQRAVVAVARWLQIDLPPATEAERLDRIRAEGVPPASCGPDMPVAPARGRMIAFSPRAFVLTAKGYDMAHVGYRGRDAARARDVWDEMADQAKRAGGFDPFTARQKDAGRAYAALVERHQSVGLRGRSVETMQGRGGLATGGISEAVLKEGDTITAMQASIGDGWALEVRRQTKRRRAPLSVRELVDRVCLGGQTIGAVLQACGWSVKGETRDRAQDVLARALDRMAWWQIVD